MFVTAIFTDLGQLPQLKQFLQGVVLVLQIVYEVLWGILVTVARAL